MNKILFFELNEVPFRVIDYFCRVNPDSTLARLMPSLRQYETYSEDVSSLSPWKTWPTVHRGVVDEKHTILDFGQDLTLIDKVYPPLWKILTQGGVTTGVFGCLHSYPVPESLENYVFYVPDVFASDFECFPDTLSSFQAFNLEMTRRSARNVTRSVPWRSALKLITNSSKLGLKMRTYGRIGKHISSELICNFRKNRRRTFQAVLAFDVFMKQIGSEKPEFAAFFTNHVASAMHRYWAACFPQDYDDSQMPKDWVKTYSNEINFAMFHFDQMLKDLVDFVDRNSEYALWIVSSMGQKAHISRPLETQLYMKEPEKFMAYLGLEKTDYERKSSMLPDYNFLVNERKVNELRDNLKSLMIDGSEIDWTNSNDFFRITLGHVDASKESEFVLLGGKQVSFESMGLENTRIDDKSHSTGYHMPNGILLVYDPKRKTVSFGQETWKTRSRISTLEIAPAVLDNYAIPIPDYMKTPTLAL